MSLAIDPHDWLRSIHGDWTEEVLSKLTASLDRAYVAGSKSWPEVQLEVEDFFRWVAGRLVDADDPIALLSSMHTAEVYLCLACAQGDRAALRIFHESYDSHLQRAVARVRMPEDMREDTLQKVRTHLLVSDGVEPGRIDRYAGRGPLGRWLYVAATRAALKMIRHEHRYSRRDDDAILEKLTEQVDPELQTIRAKYRQELQTSLEIAFQSLNPEQRSLLRRYMVDGLTLTQLAKMHQVSVATAFRRIRDIREGLLERTKLALQANSGLTASICDEVIAVARSGVHLSLDRLLQSAAESPPSTGDDHESLPE